MMQHNSIFVFDIETIPDTDAIYNLTGFKSDDVNELRKEMERYHLEITDGRNAFPRQPLWKVVAISFLEAEIIHDGAGEYYNLRRLKSGQADNERDLVKGFFDYFQKARPRLVSYNGRGFDLPVLKYRAMVHGVQAPWLHKGGDKWNSYTSRYSADWHNDLIETLSDYGASAKCKMNEVCSVLGFPGKFGVDGGKVSDMFDAGEMDAIRHYCETDVLNTYLLFLRQQHHTGTLSTEAYNKCIEDIQIYIGDEGGERTYLKEFEEAWADSCQGNFFLE